MAADINVDHFQAHIITFGLIGFLIISIYAIGITYDITKKAILKFHSQHDKESQDQTSMDLFILIYSNIFLIFIHMIILLFRFIFPFRNNLCNSINIASIISFQLTRTIMFIIFIRRIQHIFYNTIFNSHKKYVLILYIFTAIHLILLIFYFNWSYKSIRLIHSEYNKQVGCFIVYNSEIIVFITSLLDTIISITCLYLFVSPLYKLIIHQDDQQIKNQLFNIIIKISILYSTSILSYIIFTILKSVFPFGFYYGIFDGLINGMLLILLHPMHNTSYKNICCIMHKLCIRLCNIFHNANQNKKTIETNEQFKLTPTPISVVLENIASTNSNQAIEEIKEETPVNILVSKSIVNINKNDGQIETPGTFSQYVNDLMEQHKNSKTDTSLATPSPTDNNEMYQSPQSITYTVAIPSSTPSSVKSQMQMKSKKSNTLQFINYESIRL